MAIILNEAYALLSDPNSRLAYDKEQGKVENLRGYTGKPIYSVWVGSENEDRAVFVDEVKCVGCLKCALFAEKTFAVESEYGRARVVAQWADPEEKIQAAIETCPVDCISVVQRSNLAALEFLMSKQPRGKVRIGVGNTVGARVSDVFGDLEKFQARYAMSKGSSRKSKESNLQREGWSSAIQGIRSISSWLYWQVPGAEATTQNNLTPFIQKPTHDPNLKRLREASEARKQARHTVHQHKHHPSNILPYDEYWMPSNHVIPESHTTDPGSKNVPPSSSPTKVEEKFELSSSTQKQSDPFSQLAAIGLAAAVVFTIRMHQGGVGEGLEGHIAGSLVRDIVNSAGLQVLLAGVTWYLIGLYVVEVVRAILNRLGKDR